jgi:hypothetical protein
VTSQIIFFNEIFNNGALYSDEEHLGKTNFTCVYLFEGELKFPVLPCYV